MMKSLSVINFIRYYVDDFCCDLTISRRSYVDACRSLVKRVEKLYLNSSSIDDFVVSLHDELLASRNDKERALFSGLLKEIKRLRKYDVYFS